MLAIPCSVKEESFSAWRWAARKMWRASSVAPLIFRMSPREMLAVREGSIFLAAGPWRFPQAPRRITRKGKYLLNDPMLDGVPGERGIAIDRHLFHNVITVVAQRIL